MPTRPPTIRAALALAAACTATQVAIATPAWAHGGLNGPADNVATLLVIAALVVLFTWLRLRKRPLSTGRRRALPALPAAAVVLVGLAVVTPSFVRTTPSKKRPLTAARLRILSPAAGAHTGADVDVKLSLTGGRVVPEQQVLPVKLPGDQGHIHVRLDGNIVSMAYSLDQKLTNLSPGPHAVQAEFVAVDHAPFQNDVVATVLFTVD